MAKALRVLRLLEEEHRRLARIIRGQESVQDDTALDSPTTPEPISSNQDTTPSAGSADSATTSSTKKSSPSALASSRIGKQARDSSPSLARDIASRRGIPQPGRTPPSSAAQARARQLSPESRKRTQLVTTTKALPSITDSQATLQQAKRAQKAEEDDAFAKFYSNLTSGTMSKLSSVLAYAGLPLTAEDAAKLEQSNIKKPEPRKRTVSAGNEPDVSKIFSKAALDALEDEHRQRGTLGHGFGPAESFYVVQKTGGTSTYAEIVKPNQGHLSGIAEEDDGDFVDAKEVPGPPSPVQSRFSGQSRASFGNARTHEELELENTTLKQTLESLAGRLAEFEAHAQDASMAALTQSMVGLRPPQRQYMPAGGEVDAAMQERLRQLELQVETQAEEKQKAEALVAKQDKMLRKYSAKFEEIKKSAKEKDRVKKERAADKGAQEVSEVDSPKI